jgi:type IV secretion system protein VirB6
VLFADRIDMVMAAIAEVAAPGAPDGAAQQATSAASSGAFSPQGAMWLGTMLLLLGTVGVLVTSRIALAVLLATGPVFVVLALFGPTRGLTAGWLRALLLTAVAPLFVTLGGSLMLELVAPVVAALRNGEGAIDVRAAMALFLLACVHCALMVMMLKVAGTMAAAWNVFGLASGEAQPQAAPAGTVAAGQQASAMTEPALSASPARSAVMVRAGTAQGLAFEVSAPSSGGSREVRTHVIQGQSSGPLAATTSLPRLRARGIGSRFAAPRNSVPREMIR